MTNRLSDDRVRVLLGRAIDAMNAMDLGDSPHVDPRNCYNIHRATVSETQSLAQEVLDLRTANGILDAHIVDLEQRLAWNREALR